MNIPSRNFVCASLAFAFLPIIQTRTSVASAPAVAPSGSPNDYGIVTADDTARRPGDLADHDIVFLTADPNKRAPLVHSRDSNNGEYRFSPDARFIFASYHVASGLSAGELFVHRDGPAFIALDKGKAFSELAWEFCFKQGATPRVSLEDADARIIDFVAWSPDAARVLVSLRGGARHGDGIFAWNVYWNTRTRDFELTDYLRALNRDAVRRWRDDKFREASAPATCAEPLPGGVLTAAEAKKRYEADDGRLNAAYAAQMAKLPAKDRVSKRDDQRRWIKRRDEGAPLYASFGADAADKEVRRLQYLRGMTLQRVHDLDPESPDDLNDDDAASEQAGAADESTTTAATKPTQESSITCPSPGGRYALRITQPGEKDDGQCGVDLIEKASGKMVVDLGYANPNHEEETVLIWSEDSKRVAYATRTIKEGDTMIYCWKGSSFEPVELPGNLPSPNIAFAKGADRGVKNYGGATKPLRWLKSGELEMSTDLLMLSRVDGRSYTGTVHFTIAFDAKNHPSVRKVEKTKTQIDE